MKILGNRIFLAILVLFVAMGFYVVKKDSKNIESNLVVQAQQDNRFISIAGLRSYQSGGLIPIASTDEPAVNVSSYNLLGTICLLVHSGVAQRQSVSLLTRGLWGRIPPPHP